MSPIKIFRRVYNHPLYPHVSCIDYVVIYLTRNAPKSAKLPQLNDFDNFELFEQKSYNGNDNNNAPITNYKNGNDLSSAST